MHFVGLEDIQRYTNLITGLIEDRGVALSDLEKLRIRFILNDLRQEVADYYLESIRLAELRMLKR